MNSTRVAIVTGAAQGIGRAIALQLAKDGLDVAVDDLPLKRPLLDTLVKEIEALGRKSIAIEADVSKEDDVNNMVQAAVKELGGLDVMIANAGVAVLSPILDMDEWEEVFSTNVKGTLLCYKAAAKVMIEQGRGGRIIGAAMCSTYGSSKFAVRALTQAAACEFGQFGITVNAYAPGVIETPLLHAMDERVGELLQAGPGVYIESMTGQAAMRRIGQPEEIAHIVTFLASKESAFITGEDVVTIIPARVVTDV
ncbi:NAD-binding protein [Heliocybe sulcata]|uniref:NAD-binding protein n=1 Tax=Heliocybe sulcata TaxID=5364 RepID=A0A5C3N7A8_9AGAM|nr:NAD-binding protein [Heliocybe sulcata]